MYIYPTLIFGNKQQTSWQCQVYNSCHLLNNFIYWQKSWWWWQCKCNQITSLFDDIIILCTQYKKVQKEIKTFFCSTQHCQLLQPSKHNKKCATLFCYKNTRKRKLKKIAKDDVDGNPEDSHLNFLLFLLMKNMFVVVLLLCLDLGTTFLAQFTTVFYQLGKNISSLLVLKLACQEHNSGFNAFKSMSAQFGHKACKMSTCLSRAERNNNCKLSCVC